MGKFIFIFFISFLFVACSFERLKQVTGEDDFAPLGKDQIIDYAWVQQNIYVAGRCTNCHGAWANLTSTSYPEVMSRTALSGKKYIVPGDPGASAIFDEINSGRMPKNGARLSQNRIDGLVLWIQQGAIEGGIVKPKPEDPLTDLDFQLINKKIIQPYCISCHSPGGEADYVDFSTYEGVKAKLNLADPKNSRIYKSVLSGRMPQNQPRLSDDNIKLILKWIENGAPNFLFELNYKTLSKKVFEPRCNACHNPSGEAFLYDFTSYDVVKEFVNLADPEKSLIYLNVKSGNMPPKPNEPLDQSDLNLILQWIREGAKP